MPVLYTKRKNACDLTKKAQIQIKSWTPEGIEFLSLLQGKFRIVNEIYYYFSTNR